MEQYLRSIFLEALAQLEAPSDTVLKFEAPQNPEHGDFATNVAMTLSRTLRQKPRDIAEALIAKLRYDPAVVESVSIAGPGFINVRLTSRCYTDQLAQALELESAFGRTNANAGKTINLEWVSANPTGNLHAGHGRQVCLGLAVANLLEWTGANVVREYYFNNAGNQMRNLGISVKVRYLQALGEQVELPENGYHGVEIKEIAAQIQQEFGNAKRDESEDFFRSYGEKANFARIRATLTRLGVQHDIYFNENSLYENGAVERTIQTFRERGLAYDKDGAVWLRLSAMGETDDRVIVKSSGEPTYRLPDIAYHCDKLSRGYDEVIDIFGADHIATIPDVLAAIRSLGYDADRVRVLIHQMVTFISGGELIKFSKRSGGTYTLDELLDDVGTDAAKFFFTMRAVGSHLEFDVELAKEQSDKNPVYYVQYAHARTASLLRFAAQEGIAIETSGVDLSVLTHPEEQRLIKLLLRLPEVIQSCAQALAPHHLCEYLRDVAAQFHKFYHDCRIVQSEASLRSARLALVLATKHVLATGCTVLGVTAPDSM